MSNSKTKGNEKMKRMLAMILSVVTLMSFLLVLTSCGGTKPIVIVPEGGNNQTPPDSKAVNVYLNGGGNISVTEDTTFDNIIAMRPTREGYDFAGWYSDESFNDYINPNAIAKAQRNKGTVYAKWIQVESQTYYVRESVATITDSGRKNQKMDKVGAVEDFNFTDLKRAGYSKLVVSVSADVCEIDDGYQYIFIYASSTCTDNSVSSVMDFYDKYVFGETKEDPSLCYMHKFEHGSGFADPSWETVTFEVTLDLSRFSDDIYLRYGASGKNDDNWQNRNIVVSVTPTK